MRVHLESTDKIVELKLPSGASVPARLWQGATESGIECHAYITRIAVSKDLDASQFERELQEQAVPRVDLQVIPTRLVI